MTSQIKLSAPVQIIVGSMLGATEYVAESLQEILKQSSMHSEIHFQPNYAEINPTGCWIICSSTHGAGDLPDNIQKFGASLKKAADSKALKAVSFLTVALGDSSYDTFCQAGKTLHQDMLNAAAVAINDVFCIDVLNHSVPEDTAAQWLSKILKDQESANS